MRSDRRTPPAARVLAVLVAAFLTTALLPAVPAAAEKVRVDKRFFGVHDASLSSVTTGVAGSIRLWDAGVTWRDIETSPGVYNFARLDAIVAAARARNVEVTLVLGMTPDFYGGATAFPTDPGAWTRYVTALAQRYRNVSGHRGIAAYQVWNEANVKNFWTGTPLQMAQLTKATWHAVKAVDKGALVVAPAMAARIGEQARGIGFFYFARISGIPIWRFVDVISLNLYPLDRYLRGVGTPEISMELLAKARKSMRLRGVPQTKPIWNTEVNYGMRTGDFGGTRAVAISPERQAAYVLRTYLLNAAAGVQRVHWYTWNMGFLPSGGTLGNTLMTNPADGQTLTVAGRAFGLAQRWLLGGKLVGESKSKRPCAQDRRGTYTCVITYRGGVRRVYWNPTKKVTVKTADKSTYQTGVYGKRTAVKAGATIRVDYRPVMVRSKS